MKKPLFDYIAGTGGIGTGRFFELEGNHTLSRSESRPGRFTEYRDYCKLHIILHYPAVFLRGKIPVYAIGRIGADEEGRNVKKEMVKAGINAAYVTEDLQNPTMYSICCQYPDGEGFNVTANNSACNRVGAEDINRFFNEQRPGVQGIIIAAPEVPLETRIYLLEQGRKRQCYNMAAVSSGEIPEFVKQNGIPLTDLVALNLDEARVFASLGSKETNAETDFPKACADYLRSLNPEITVVVTLGRKGALAQYKNRLYRKEALPVKPVNTAGAGDSFLGTMAAAMVWGIDIFPPEESQDIRGSAVDLGIAVSGKKVECRDTIDFSMDPGSLEKFSLEQGIVFSDSIQEAFFRQ